MKTRAEYQRMAGDLKDRYQRGETHAKMRVNVVWLEARVPGFTLGLQRAQHVIAKEHGAASWGDLVKDLP
jgi:hypothetical protein